MLYQRHFILQNIQIVNTFRDFKRITQSPITKEVCNKSVLEIMKNGFWLPHKMTKNQRKEIEDFLIYARGGHGIPKTLERPDKKCGNVSFENARPFRALCNPQGSTPCCENNKCVEKSVEKCRCSNCLDERPFIHAEYSQWIPRDKNCPIRYYNSQEACELLSGKTIMLVGDSLIRQFFTGFISLLRNDYQTGGLERNPKQSILENCTGLYVYTEKLCRSHIDRFPKGLCPGKVRLIFKEYSKLNYANAFKGDVEWLSKKNESSLIVCGIGPHDQYQSRKVMYDFLMPALNILKTRPKTKFLFATPHSPGNLKSPRLHQSLDIVLKFISEMESMLKKMNMPLFNTVSMTENIVSFDGAHYGLGVNKQKVIFLLNYIQELKDQGNW